MDSSQNKQQNVLYCWAGMRNASLVNHCYSACEGRLARHWRWWCCCCCRPRWRAWLSQPSGLAVCVAVIKMSATLPIPLLLTGVGTCFPWLSHGCCEENFVPQHVAPPYSFYSTNPWLLRTLSTCVCMCVQERAWGRRECPKGHGSYAILSS